METAYSEEKIKSELNQLFEQLDESALQDIDVGTINEAYQQLYKYGQIIEGADNFLTFSFTNLTGEYQSKLWTTAMIGYLFRTNDEWEVPDDVQVFPVYDYCRAKREGRNLISEFYKKHKEISPKVAAAIKANEEKMADRIVVRKFLENVFQYDPDRHVRSAYRPQPRDKNRTVLETPAAKLAINTLKHKDSEFREAMLDHERNVNLMNMAVATPTTDQSKPYTVDFFNNLVDGDCDVKGEVAREFQKTDHQMYNVVQKLMARYKNIDELNAEYLNSCVNIMDDVFNKINDKFALPNEVLNEIKTEIKESYDGRLRVLSEKNKEAVSVLQDIVSSLHRDYGTIDGKILANTYNMIPPADVFYRIKNYKEANYDQLVEAVKNLYCDIPELDMAILPHNWHATEDSARDYIKRHRNQAIAEVVTAQSGMWNFFAPYSKVRDTTVFLNDKTIVLEEILAQRKRDEQITQDILKNRVQQRKKENIREEGDVAEGFKDWCRENNTLKAMGAMEINPYEDDCPADAVEVNVFRVNPGKGSMEATKLYSKAEAPKFMEDKKSAA